MKNYLSIETNTRIWLLEMKNHWSMVVISHPQSNGIYIVWNKKFLLIKESAQKVLKMLPHQNLSLKLRFCDFKKRGPFL